MPMPVKLIETDLPGVLLVETGCAADERGFFAETWSRQVWRDAGFGYEFVQDNLSLSERGVLRGMHYQLEPHPLGKLVRAVTGAIFDVGVDLRKGSPTFGKWAGYELSADNNLALWLPPGFAHGFLALQDDTRVFYKCTHIHTPEAERTLHYADPQVNVQWPIEPAIVSEKDAAAPMLESAEYNFVFT